MGNKLLVVIDWVENVAVAEQNRAVPGFLTEFIFTERVVAVFSGALSVMLIELSVLLAIVAAELLSSTEGF